MRESFVFSPSVYIHLFVFIYYTLVNSLTFGSTDLADLNDELSPIANWIAKWRSTALNAGSTDYQTLTIWNTAYNATGTKPTEIVISTQTLAQHQTESWRRVRITWTWWRISWWRTSWGGTSWGGTSWWRMAWWRVAWGIIWSIMSQFRGHIIGDSPIVWRFNRIIRSVKFWDHISGQMTMAHYLVIVYWDIWYWDCSWMDESGRVGRYFIDQSDEQHDEKNRHWWVTKVEQIWRIGWLNERGGLWRFCWTAHCEIEWSQESNSSVKCGSQTALSKAGVKQV